MNWMGEPSSWEVVKARFPIGSTANGVVVNVAPFGVFINLGDGAIGLLLVPEMAGDHRKQLADYPKVGEQVTARVLWHRDSNRQVSLTQKGH
jgi:small subunit ribosomal protein S1